MSSTALERTNAMIARLVALGLKDSEGHEMQLDDYMMAMWDLEIMTPVKRMPMAIQIRVSFLNDGRDLTQEILNEEPIGTLLELAKARNIKGLSKLKKDAIIDGILNPRAPARRSRARRVQLTEDHLETIAAAGPFTEVISEDGIILVHASEDNHLPESLCPDGRLTNQQLISLCRIHELSGYSRKTREEVLDILEEGWPDEQEPDDDEEKDQDHDDDDDDDEEDDDDDHSVDLSPDDTSTPALALAAAPAPAAAPAAPAPAPGRKKGKKGKSRAPPAPCRELD